MTFPSSSDQRSVPVVACLRVADRHAAVNPLTGSIRTDPAGLGLSDADAAALEYALVAGDQWSAPVAAVTAGPASIDPVLREVAAHGVTVLRVETADNQPPELAEELAADEQRLARLVVGAVTERWGRPDLVVCGDRSPDRGTGAFPAFLAHELGAAQALGLVTLSIGAAQTDVVAERRLDAGWRERLRVPLPAVCSVEAAGVQLRRAPLDGALAASVLSVPVVRVAVPDPARTLPGGAVRTGMPRPFVPRPRVVPAPSGTDPRLPRPRSHRRARTARAADRRRARHPRRGRRRAPRLPHEERLPAHRGRHRGCGRRMTRLFDMAWPEADALAKRGSVLLVPVGATEQHGPHLPLTTDTDIAIALCAQVALLESRVVIAPALAYGSSGEHEAFAGTLSIGGPATQHMLVELGRSASAHFHDVVFVSTHGGNRAVMDRATSQLQMEGRSAVAWVPQWTGDLHAGRTETSLMLAVAPDRVDLAAAVAGDRRPAGILLPLLRRHGVRPVSASGVLGDPAGASAEEGRHLLDEAVAALAELVARLADSTVPTVLTVSTGPTPGEEEA